MDNKKFWDGLIKQVESMSNEEFAEAVAEADELGQLFAIDTTERSEHHESEDCRNRG